MKSFSTVAAIFCKLGFVTVCLALSGQAQAAEDILIADFEQETYGSWIVEGKAFGPGPAQGTLTGQMNVSGYKGERLVNTFFQGDGSTGTLTSPPITIKRDYIAFLIGGGGHQDQTSIQLLHRGEVVRSAEGPNTAPGGSENLEAHGWDVSEFKGKIIQLRIVDQAKGGWGHINVDHILQTDTKPKITELNPQSKEFVVHHKYLAIPIKNGAKKTEINLEINGEVVRRYGTELAANPDDVDWYAFFNLETYEGKRARVSASRATAEGFALMRPVNKVPGSDSWYSEALRPQFHFSQKVGWNNDPNGMVYLDGEWHLFFQHNPVGWSWGNMTWGHAVSRDLIHWEQLPNKLFPKTMAVGDCFSGGATIDHMNTAGWKTGNNDVLVAFLTDTGAGESLAYSNDKGRTFTWFEGNPVVKHKGRDPKVIWYAYDDQDVPLNQAAKKLGGHWVMVVYDQDENNNNNAAFYTSINLKDWQEQSHLKDYFECTELFELPVDGDRSHTRWVVFAADARYAIGDFDGRIFIPEHPGKHQVHWGDYYASQTFDNAPDGRRIQMGWIRVATPGMPFNQTFSFPHELTLRKTSDGVRMFANPIQELETIHDKKHSALRQELVAEAPVMLKVAGDLFEVRATFEIGQASKVGVDIGGNRVVYDVVGQRLDKAEMKPVDGAISLQVLVDRTTLETCGNDGRVFITSPREIKGEVDSITAFAEGTGAKLTRFEAYELNSTW